jgi:hypothetical protein
MPMAFSSFSQIFFYRYFAPKGALFVQTAWQCVKEVEGMKISIAAIAFATKKT